MSDHLATLIVAASLALILFGGAAYTHLDWHVRQYRQRRDQRRRMGMLR